MSDLQFNLLLVFAIALITWQIHTYIKTRYIYALAAALYLTFVVIIGIVRHYA